MTNQSPGRATALLTLAPIAAREAEARKKKQELAEALAELPELPRPDRPQEPPAARFESRRFAAMLWLTPFFLIFVGNWVSDKTIFDSGYPWIPMLLLPVLLGVVSGFWQVIKQMPARERFRAEMQTFEASIAAADRREGERAEILARFTSGELAPDEGDASRGRGE